MSSSSYPDTFEERFDQQVNRGSNEQIFLSDPSFYNGQVLRCYYDQLPQQHDDGQAQGVTEGNVPADLNSGLPTMGLHNPLVTNPQMPPMGDFASNPIFKMGWGSNFADNSHITDGIHPNQYVSHSGDHTDHGTATTGEANPHPHLTHAGNKQWYRCTEPKCQSLFKRKGDMERHARGHGPPLYFCSFEGCKYRTTGFTRKDKWLSHEKTHCPRNDWYRQRY